MHNALKSNFPLIKITAVLAAVLILLASCGSGQSQSTEDAAAAESSAAFTHLEPDAAKSMIEAGECILVDTRGEPQFDYERIPGSVNVPVDSDDETILHALPDKNAKILLYCDYGGLSKQMGDHMALDLGYTNLYEFDGLLVWDGELEGQKYE